MTAARPNVILIAIDTMRASHLGCYGYARDTTPNLDRFAEDSVRFARCINHSAHTLPSFTTLITGLEPATHECPATLWNTLNEARQQLDDYVPVLAQTLATAGHTTVAIDDLAGFGCGPHWFAKGWEYYINLRFSVARGPGPIRSDFVARRAVEWIEANLAQPFFMFLHPWDTHQRYAPPAPFDAKFVDFDVDLKPITTQSGVDYVPECGPVSALNADERDSVNRYDGEYAYVDHHVGQFLERLKQMGLYDDAMVIVWSDHGDDMAEHHCHFEHRECYDAALHVPLLIKYPRGLAQQTAGRVVDSLVSNADIMPTILEFLEIEPPESPKPMNGLGLNAAATGDATKVRDAVRSTGCWILGDDDHWKAVEVSARTQDHRLIRRADITRFIPFAEAHPIMKFHGLVRERGVPVGPELFQSLPRVELIDLRADPEEQINRADDLPETVAAMDRHLESWRRSRAIAL